MDYQKRYWNMLSDLVYARYYWHYIAVSKEKRLKYIKIFITVSTCTGVTVFLALFRNDWIRWISAALVALGQLATSLLPVLEYERMTRSLQDVSSRLAVLSLMIEKDWDAVGGGRMTEDEIRNLSMYYEGVKTNIEHSLDMYGIENEKDAEEKALSDQAEYVKYFDPRDDS